MSLTDFLIKNNVFDTFTANLFFNRQISIKDFEKSTHIDDYILDAFYWRKTPQGSKFWDELNKKYIKDINGK